MPDKQPSLDEFSSLIRELETPRNRPASSFPPAQFTADLRRHLLQGYDQQPLSWRGTMRLWRFAGTAVALMVVAVAVGYIWLALSSPAPAVSPAIGTAPETPTPTIEATSTAVSNDLPLIINPDADIKLIDFAPEPGPYQSGQSISFTLRWLVVRPPQMEFVTAVHLLDAKGNLIAQLDRTLGEDTQPPPTWEPETVIQDNYTFTLPKGLKNGSYTLAVALYDAQTGKRLTGNSVYVMEDTITIESDKVWIISAAQSARASANAPIQFEVIVGYDLVSAPEAMMKLHYAHPDWEGNRFGRIPIDGMSDFVPITADKHNVTFQFTGSPSEMQAIVNSVNPIPVVMIADIVEGSDNIDILTMSGFPDYPFALDSADEVHYGDDRVETAVAPYAIITNTNGLGLTLRDSPAGEQMGILREGVIVELLEQEPVIVDEATWHLVRTAGGLTGWVMDDYLAPIDTAVNDRVWLVSATQKERATAMVSFEVTVGMEIESAPQETAVFQLHIAHPDWENNGLIDRNSFTFQPVSANTYRLIATPDQIRQATGTDNPVLVVEIWLLVTDSQTPLNQIEPTIRETFIACPMDLTRSDEFTCTP